MLKPIKWSSYANDDFAKLLDYLEAHWNSKVCTNFIDKLNFCVHLIQKNPNQFPLFNLEFQIRKCKVTKQNTLYYRESNFKILITNSLTDLFFYLYLLSKSNPQKRIDPLLVLLPDF